MMADSIKRGISKARSVAIAVAKTTAVELYSVEWQAGRAKGRVEILESVLRFVDDPSSVATVEQMLADAKLELERIEDYVDQANRSASNALVRLVKEMTQ